MKITDNCQYYKPATKSQALSLYINGYRVSTSYWIA